MNSTLMDGKGLAHVLNMKLKDRVDKLKESYNITPCLAVISAGDEAGKVYIRSKQKACEKLGIRFEHYDMTEDRDEPSYVETMSLIHHLNDDPKVNGIIIQSPFADCNRTQYIHFVNRIGPDKDVDGLNRYNVGNLWCYENHQISPNYFFEPCTPTGIIKLLLHYLDDISGMNAVILGRSDLVGKPLAKMLMDEKCTVTICHSQTERLMYHVAHADILVTAMGKPGVITQLPRGIKALVDVSINRDQDGKLVGDIPKYLYDKFEYYTPVPGGVGPMTVAMLMQNVVEACCRQNKIPMD